MNDTERFDRWFSPAVSRRTLLRGGLLGGVGLAAAALIGCGGDDDDDDDNGGTTATTSGSSGSTTTTSSSSSSSSSSDSSASSDDSSDDSEDDTTTDANGGEEAGVGMLVQDPDLPYPYQFPEPGGLTPKAGGVMRVAATWDVGSMDPIVSAAGGSITVPNMVYNKLLGMVGGPAKDPFKIEIKPELASSWERTPDGQVFSFQLRDDVKWHNVAPLNGRALVAQDIKFAYDRYKEEGVHQSYWTNIGSIDAVDDHQPHNHHVEGHGRLHPAAGQPLPDDLPQGTRGRGHDRPEGDRHRRDDPRRGRAGQPRHLQQEPRLLGERGAAGRRRVPAPPGLLGPSRRLPRRAVRLLLRAGA